MRRFFLGCCLASACGAAKPNTAPPPPRPLQKTAATAPKQPPPGKCKELRKDGTVVEVKCK